MIVHESGQYICNLCGRMNLMGRSRIHPHVRSKIHTDNVNSIDIMYHPVYGTVRKVTETNAAVSHICKYFIKLSLFQKIPGIYLTITIYV